MTTTMNGNGHIGRKSLAGQLDRLDSILDVLSDGLNEAVATVVQEAVGKAVELAVKEVLCNPDVLRAMRAQAAPETKRASTTTVRPDFLRGAWSFGRTTVGRWLSGAAIGLGRARAWIAGKCWQAATALSAQWHTVAGNCGAAWGTLVALVPLAWRARTQVAMAGVIGTALAAGCWWSGPTIAATVCGLAGFAGSLFASALKVLRRAQAASAV